MVLKKLTVIVSAVFVAATGLVLPQAFGGSPVAYGEDKPKDERQEFLDKWGIKDPHPGCWKLSRKPESSQIGGKDRYDTANLWRGRLESIDSLYMIDMPGKEGELSNSGWGLAVDALAAAVSDGNGYVFQMNRGADYTKRESLEGPFGGEGGSTVRWDGIRQVNDFTTGQENKNSDPKAPKQSAAMAATKNLVNLYHKVGTLYKPNQVQIRKIDRMQSLVVVQNGLGSAVLSALPWALQSGGVPMSEAMADRYVAEYMSDGVDLPVIYVGGEAGGLSWAARHGIDVNNPRKYKQVDSSTDFTTASREAVMDRSTKGRTTGLDLLYIVRGTSPQAMLSDALSSVQYYYSRDFRKGKRAGLLFWDTRREQSEINNMVAKANPIKIFLAGGFGAVGPEVGESIHEAIIQQKGEPYREEDEYCQPEISSLEKWFVDKPSDEAAPGWANKGDNVIFEIRVEARNIWTAENTNEGRYPGVPQRVIKDTLPDGLTFVQAWENNSSGSWCSYEPDRDSGVGKSKKVFNEQDYQNGFDLGAQGSGYQTQDRDICVQAKVSKDIQTGTKLINKACTSGEPGAKFMPQKCAEGFVKIDEPRVVVTKKPYSYKEPIAQGDTIDYGITIENKSHVKAAGINLFDYAKEGLVLKTFRVGSGESDRKVPGDTPTRFDLPILQDLKPARYYADVKSYRKATDEKDGCADCPEGAEFCKNEIYTWRECGVHSCWDMRERKCMAHYPEKMTSTDELGIQIGSEVTKVDKTNMFATVDNLAKVCSDWFCKDVKQAPEACEQGDETCSESIIQQGNAALKIVKKLSDPENVHAGQQTEWDVTVTNVGDVAALNVVVTDDGGTGVDTESIKISSAPDKTPRARNIGNIDPGESESVTVTGKPTSDKPENVACAEADNAMKVCSKEKGAESSKLAVTKTVDRVLPDGLQYLVELSNTGEGRSQKVTLQDQMSITGSEKDYPAKYEVTSTSGMSVKDKDKDKRQATTEGVPGGGKAGFLLKADKSITPLRGEIVNQVFPADDPKCENDKNKPLCASVSESSVNVAEDLIAVDEATSTAWFKVTVAPTVKGVGAHGVSVKAASTAGASGERFVYSSDLESAPADVKALFPDGKTLTVGSANSSNIWQLGDIPADTVQTGLLAMRLDNLNDGYVTYVSAGTALYERSDFAKGCENNTDVAADTDGCDVVDARTQDPADVHVSKTFLGSEGGKSKFEITVSNRGAAPSRDLTFTELTPGGKKLEWEKWSTVDKPEGSQWHVGKLKGGVSVSATVNVDGVFTAGEVNKVFPNDDPGCANFVNECASAGPVSLQVSKEPAGSNMYAPGESVQWTLKAKASGGVSSGAKIVDVPLAGLKDVKLVSGAGKVDGLVWEPGDIGDGVTAEATVSGIVTDGAEKVVNAVTGRGSVPTYTGGEVSGCLDEDGVEKDTDLCDFSAAPVASGEPEPGPEPEPEPGPGPVEPTPKPDIPTGNIKVTKTVNTKIGGYDLLAENIGKNDSKPLVLDDNMRVSGEGGDWNGAWTIEKPSVGKVSGDGHSWTIGVLKPGKKAKAHVAVTAPETWTPDSVINEAQIRGVDCSKQSGGCASVETAPVQMDKKLLSAKDGVGEWLLTVKNPNSVPVNGVRVVEQPSTGLSGVTITPDTGEVSVDGYTWNVGSLDQGGTVKAKVKARISGVSAINRARVYSELQAGSAETCSANYDADSDDDSCDQESADVQAPVEPDKAKVVVLKTPRLNTPTPQWDVIVKNVGNVASKHVYVVDELVGAKDGSLKFMDSAGGGTVWDVGVLQPGEQKQTSVFMSTVGTFTNRVFVADNPTPDSPGSCQDNSTLGGDTDGCDIAVWSADGGRVKNVLLDVSLKDELPDGRVSWLVSVRNGSGKTLPAGVSVASDADGAVKNGGFVSASQGEAAGGVWKTGRLDDGGEASAVWVGSVSDGAVRLKAWVSDVMYGSPCVVNDSLDTDTDSCDVSEWRPGEIPAGERLKVHKRLESKSGDVLRWSLTVANEGKSPASGVKVWDVPDGKVVGPVSGGKFDKSGVWNVGALPAGKTLRVEYETSLLPGEGEGANVVWVTSARSPEMPAGCRSNETVAEDKDRCDYVKVDGAGKSGGVSVSKEFLDADVASGRARWQVTVENTSGGKASGVVVKDVPVSGLRSVRFPDGGDSLMLGDLGAGEKRSVVVGSVLESGVSEFENMVFVGVERPESCVSGLCATASGRVGKTGEVTAGPGGGSVVPGEVAGQAPVGGAGVVPAGVSGGGSGGALAVTGVVAGVALVSALLLSGGGGVLMTVASRRRRRNS